MELRDEDNDDRGLYRVQYLEVEDASTVVEWVWLSFEEIGAYRSDYNQVKIRQATEEESDLYEEAYSDGYGVAAMLEFEDRYDGVTFRVELNEAGELDFEGKKMFECAVCGKHKDFDEEVGMAGGLYLGEIKDDKLWHVCYGCAENAAMLKSIEETALDDSEPTS
jgi:hypothetical protein